MKRRRFIITIAIIVVILVGWLVIDSLNNRSSSGPAPSSILTNLISSITNQSDDSGEDVGESAPNDDSTSSQKAMADLISRASWVEQLPYFSDHFSVYLNSEVSTDLTVVLTSKNSAEFATYQAEARNWLKSQNVPDSTVVTYRYLGQP